MTISDELIERTRNDLYAAVLSDTLDFLGEMDQAMQAQIRPLDDNRVLCGRARTAMYMEVFHVAPGENPYDLEIALIDDLGSGDVAVMGCGGSQRIAPWGELLSTASKARGAVGCVTDGLVRDVRMVREMGFPVFHGGIAPLDSKGRGKVMAVDVPIACGGVDVSPGDLVFGDADGVVVVPERMAENTLRLALEKVSGENRVRDELARGDSLRDVFARHGIL
jgi:4-hydroxy-4-methyl-2-oxoglutarate aldolase